MKEELKRFEQVKDLILQGAKSPMNMDLLIKEYDELIPYKKTFAGIVTMVVLSIIYIGTFSLLLFYQPSGENISPVCVKNKAFISHVNGQEIIKKEFIPCKYFKSETSFNLYGDMNK